MNAHSRLLDRSPLRNTAALLILAALMLATPWTALALSTPGGLETLDEREREVLEALASRPAEQREAALIAAQYPDVLVRSELIQARSSAAFELRVERLDREHQEELWELVRTPGALSELVSGGRKSESALEALAKRHPEPARGPIVHLGGEHFETLEEAEAIKASADIEFSEEIGHLPADARAAFETLLADAELLAMLARSPGTAVALGDSYASDPDGTRARIDQLAIEVAAGNLAVEEEWRETLEDDPEAQAELEQAAREYSEEYGYAYDDLVRKEVHVTVHRYVTPYPYWFGYPSWYSYWVPWGVWYPVRPHFGYYSGHYYPRPVYYGLPSLHFVHWFYGGHQHRYRHVSRHFDHSRHGHHRSSHPVYRTVRRHDRHERYAGHRRHGSPESIDGRSFRHRQERTRGAQRGTRRAGVDRSTREFRDRSVRLPDSSFARRDVRRPDAERRRGPDRAGRVAQAERRAEPRAERGGDRGSRGRVRDRASDMRRGRGDDAGRVVRVDRLPQVDASGPGSRDSAPRDQARRQRSGRDRSAENRERGRTQRTERRRDRVARPDVVKPRVAKPSVRRERTLGPRVERSRRSTPTAPRVERSAPSSPRVTGGRSGGKRSGALDVSRRRAAEPRTTSRGGGSGRPKATKRSSSGASKRNGIRSGGRAGSKGGRGGSRAGGRGKGGGGRR